MALLDGKQLRVQSTSLDKLSGHSGLVTFTASATMSFGAGSTLRQASENILTSLDVVNKNYVDSVAQGLSVKPSVHVISNTNSVVLSGTQSIDGVVLNIGERVLVNYQGLSGSADASNGIYVVASGSWTRAEDSDGVNIGSEVQLGNFVFVAFGQSFAGTGWVLSQTNSPDYDILVGTESQLWTQFSSTATINAGEGLVQNGQDFDILTGTGLTVSVIDNKLNIADTGVTASNYGSTNSVGAFSVNSQGQLTSAQSILIDIDSSQINNFSTATEAVIFTDANFVDGSTIQFDVTTGASTSAQVVLGSLTASRLDIINSASASQNYVLGFNAGGQFEWFEPSQGDITEVIAGNGLQGGGPSGSVTLDVNTSGGLMVVLDSVQIDPLSAGNGLTFSSGVFDINIDPLSGLTFSGDSISIDTSIAGNGLDYAAGVLTVNTSEITSALAGDGLIANGSAIDVQVDTAGLTVSGDTVRLQTTITGDRTFADTVTVNGNLQVNGTVSYIYTQNVLVADNILTLNATFSGVPFLNSGIEVNRGSETYASLIWNELTDLWSAGLSGSETSILLNAGGGLVKNGATVSLDFVSIVGTGLTQNGLAISLDSANLATALAGDGLSATGATLSVNTSGGLMIALDDVQIDPTAAGIGLTFSAGVFDLNIAGASGLSVSNTNFLSIDLGIGGAGLTFSGGVLGVNTTGGITTILDFVQIDPTLAGQGLTFSSGVLDVIWGGTASGLSFSNGYAQIEVDNSTIQINTSGQLVAVGGSSQPVYLTTTAVTTTGNDSEVTGTTIGATPSDFSRIQVFVNGQLQRLGNGNPLLDCYFGTTGSSTLLVNLQSGDQLYWNGTNAGFELSATDKIDIIYES